jgi:endonuclease/exonuclease/phosphatase (EEP) superfamily protein YafD
LIRARIQAAPGVEFALASVHMPTLRFGFYRFLNQDADGLKEHVAWWDRQLGRLRAGLAELRGVPLLVGGDFNVPPDQSSMAALGAQFRFAFEDAGWGYGYTRPTRYPWFRIDHLLASPEWVFTRCWVGPNVGSDHLPLIAEAVLSTHAGTRHR